MIEIKNLSISVNDKLLVENLNLTLNKGDKLAIIGEEGNGKSTLLKAIVGLCDYAEIKGTIDYKNNSLSYLSQTINPIYLDTTVLDYLFTSTEDYYASIGNLYAHLFELGLDESILNQKINTLSGGEKVKVSILKMLLEECDILLLDEPTNDLDIDTLEWLETFIINSKKPIIFVSHDEELLSRTANTILHLEQRDNKSICTYTLEKCTYDEYINARLRKLSHLRVQAGFERREYRKKEEKLNQLINKVEYRQSTISRSDPHGARLLKKKMHALKSQEKKLENTELTEVPRVEEAIDFFFKDNPLPASKTVLNLDIPVLKVATKTLSRNIKLHVVGNEHICIIGKNGVGKSTLIKIIYEELSQKKDIKLGYMPQNYEDILGNFELVLDFASDKNKDNITTSRTLLASLNFTKEETLGSIRDLSNGSKAKLLLAKLVLSECNVLLLDEPTRNTSPLSNPVIRKVLASFKGPIISVSHDRKYINEVCSKIYILDETGLTLQSHI